MLIQYFQFTEFTPLTSDMVYELHATVGAEHGRLIVDPGGVFLRYMGEKCPGEAHKTAHWFACEPKHFTIGVGPQVHKMSFEHRWLDVRWKVAPSEVIPRNKETIANAMLSLAVGQKTVHLIDPHIRAVPRFYEPLQEFLSTLAKLETRPKEVNVFTGEEKIGALLDQVKPNVPPATRLRIFRIEKNDLDQDFPDGFHNRYVLAGRGGIAFGWGLDIDAKSPPIGNERKDIVCRIPAMYATEIYKSVLEAICRYAENPEKCVSHTG